MWFFGICYILLDQHIFRKNIFSTLAKCVLWPGEMASQFEFGPGPLFGEPLYRLWRRVVTAHTIVGVQYQRWTVVINSVNTDTIFWAGIQSLDCQQRDTHQHRTPTTPSKAFHKETGRTLSRGRQNMCFVCLWHAPRISQICWRVEICSAVLRPWQKPHWVLSSFGSIIFLSWHAHVLGDLAKTCRGSWFIHSCLPICVWDDQFANLSVPFKNAMPLDTHEYPNHPAFYLPLIHCQTFRN